MKVRNGGITKLEHDDDYRPSLGEVLKWWVIGAAIMGLQGALTKSTSGYLWITLVTYLACGVMFYKQVVANHKEYFGYTQHLGHVDEASEGDDGFRKIVDVIAWFFTGMMTSFKLLMSKI